MRKIKRLFKSFYRLLLPIVILFILAVGGASVWLAQRAAIAPKALYLLTPDKYGRLSSRGAQVTEETWSNMDGTTARGWLLRGSMGSPAVVLLHGYGADRSHILNLGVKLNEATDFTILMPDQRGHGDTPHVKYTSFGGFETEDALAAIKFLRDLKVDPQTPLVGQSIGLYGTELGALAAVFAAAKDENVKTLVLDSAPSGSDALLAAAIKRRFPFASSVTSKFAELGTRLYFYEGGYRRDAACEAAKTLAGRQVLLLAGADNPDFQSSTNALERCFPDSTKTEIKTDLNPSGYNIINASLEQSEAYDQRVISFFNQAMSN
jgi:pimeloyl-ACP methyl ester carboxylesterase